MSVLQTEAARDSLVKYVIAGIVFGIIITRSEIISWFRIQEMFRFDAFHMYGIFITAIPTAIIAWQLLRRSSLKSLTGEEIRVPPKQLGRGVRYIVGGIMFGLGWALVGACPGPLFALLGSGVLSIAIVIVSAVGGTWMYGYLRPRLPH